MIPIGRPRSGRLLLVGVVLAIAGCANPPPVPSGTDRQVTVVEEEVASRAKRLGPDDPEVADLLVVLAGLRFNNGNGAEAERLLRHALSIYEANRGPEHAGTGIVLNDLGWLYYTQGRYAEAEPLFKRSVEIYDAPDRAHDARTAKVLENYATLLRAMNRAEEAERFEARARSIRSDRP